MCDAVLTRRDFVAVVAAAAGVVANPLRGALRTLGSSTPVSARRKPVVGFHMDRPYLDPSGMAEPYLPPAGTRSGEILAQLSETEFLSLHPYG